MVSIPVNNLYGPKEASVDVTFYSVIPNDTKVPIGRPIWNIQIYILDKATKVRPIGQDGEIFIGGVGLARGYLNHPELTSEKFVENPFRSGERMYRTGDLGRWLEDGNIEFLGRIDDQVKIRGYRIELKEIKNLLLEHKNIKECIVVPFGENEDEYLCAYLITFAGMDPEEFSNYLSNKVPDYMIPKHYIALHKFPLTTTGKININALPSPERKNKVVISEIGNEIEERLIKIWSDLLKLVQGDISLEDNFFELGGHSLKIIKLRYLIRLEFEVNITLEEIFDGPTIKEIAKKIS